MNDTSAVLDTVHRVESLSLEQCRSSLCENRFPKSGLAINPRRFCSEICKHQASIIHRTAMLLSGLPDSAVIGILKGERGAWSVTATFRRSAGNRQSCLFYQPEDCENRDDDYDNNSRNTGAPPI